MTAERWSQLEKLFNSALAVEAESRDGYLRDACAGDASLYSELAAMIAQHHRPDALLDRAGALLDVFAPTPGETIDRYIITRRLGQGGMGQVLEARDTRLDRLVAIKLLPANSLLTPGLAERFEREARAASSLNHPNVVTILDHQSAPVPYIVTELVEGDTLRSRLPLPLPEASTALAQIASALAAVHRAGIVHRDLKPENIMLRPDGIVKLIDFGLARLSVAGTFQTEQGIVVGTYAYMAPEQLSGAETDARSDVYSYGRVAEELTGGKAGWSHVAARCLERDPSRRYRDGTELLAAVGALGHRTRRRILAACGTGVLSAASGYYLWKSAKRGPAFEIRQMIQITDSGDVLLSACSLDGKVLAMVCGASGDERLVVSHQPSGSESVLMRPSQAHFTGVSVSPDGNFVYASYLDRGTIASLWRFPISGGEPVKIVDDVDSSISIDRSKGRIAFVRRTRKDSRLLVLEAGSERVLSQRPGDSPHSHAGPTWSPDGSTIAIPTGFQMRIDLVDAATGATKQVPGPPSPFIGRLAWRGLNHLIAPVARTAGVPAQLHLVDVRDGSSIAITNDVSAYYEPGLSDSGSLVALRQDLFSYLSVNPGNRRVSFGREQFRQVRWIDAASVVVTRRAGGQTDLWKVDTATGNRTRLTGDTAAERDPCWSASAQRFAVFSGRDRNWNLWSFDAGGRDWRQLTTGNTGGRFPDWTPDGSKIVFEANRDGVFGVWVVHADGSGLRRLRPGLLRMPSVSPDGALIACQYEENKRWRVGVFRLATGELAWDAGEDQLLTPARWQRDAGTLLWVRPNGRRSELAASGGTPRIIRRLEEQGAVDSFDVSGGGAIVHLTAMRQADIVRLAT